MKESDGMYQNAEDVVHDHICKHIHNKDYPLAIEMIWNLWKRENKDKLKPLVLK